MMGVVDSMPLFARRTTSVEVRFGDAVRRHAELRQFDGSALLNEEGIDVKGSVTTHCPEVPAFQESGRSLFAGCMPSLRCP